MTITGQSALNKDDIARMVRDAETHAEEDRRRREEAETRNQAESLVYQTEKFVKENEAKLSGGVKDNVNKAVEEVRQALKDNADKEKLDSLVSKLEAASHKMAEEAYKAATPPPPQGEPQPEPAGATAGGPSGGKKQDQGDVIDADFKVVDEKK